MYFQNADAAVQALGKGEVDLINRLAPAQFDSLKGKDPTSRSTRRRAAGSTRC